MPELVLLIGLPAAGKSTFRQQRFSGSHVVVSKDLMPNNKNRERRQQQLIREALQQGQNVVVDNTNVSAADRTPLIAIARELGASITGYYFRTDPAQSMQRNKQREGKAKVPPVAIFTALKRLQLPSPAEGFTALYHVRPQQGMQFEVRPWEE